MSTVYAPNGANGSLNYGAASRVAIESSAGTTPIQIETTLANGFNTGDTIEIQGHDYTAANGTRQITVIDATTFSLNGSVGSGGGGTTTGYAIDYEFIPAMALPDNGDLLDVGTSNPPTELLADSIPALYRLAGLFRLYDIYLGADIRSAFSVWSSTAVTALESAPQLLTASGYSGGNACCLLSLNNSSGARPIAAPYPAITSQDILECTFTTNFHASPAAGEIGLQLGYAIGAADTSAPYIPFGAPQIVSLTNADFLGLTLRGVISGLNSTSVGFDIGVLAFVPSGSSNIDLLGGWSLDVKHYRTNG